MASRRATILVGAVIALAIVQLFFEDILVFLGATSGGAGSLPPVVYLAVPGAISLLLIAILLGAGLLTTGEHPPRRRFNE